MTGPGEDNAVPGFSAKNETGLHDTNNGHTSRVSQHVARDRLLRHASEFADDLGAAIDGFLFGGISGRAHRQKRDCYE